MSGVNRAVRALLYDSLLSDIYTYAGNSRGKKCVFPFFYNNRLWDECTTHNSDIPWCATTDNFEIDKKWGFCKRKLANNDSRISLA